MSKYGIYEKALISNNLEDSLKFARNNGYDFWEIAIDKDRRDRLDWDVEEIEDLLKICLATKMPIYNMVLSIHREYPLGIKDEVIRKKGIDFLFKAIDLAVALGIRTIQLAGYISSGKDKGDGTLDLYIESLTLGVKYAAANGVMLGIENMDYDLVSTQDIEYVVKVINNPYLKMFLDVGNFSANQLDPIEQLEAVIPHLVGLHLKETQKNVYRRVDFGNGIVPFSEIFTFLKERNFDGYFGVEMWNDEQLDSLNKVKQAKDWLTERI